MNKPVSFDNELLILVDENDRELGYKSKEECHNGKGILHRAFSVFIFNDNNELLMQKRSAGKRLWPLYWSNSCCSHPRVGETYQTATQRRLKEELDFETPLQFLFRFQYQASFGDKGSENELCSVYAGRYNDEIHPNENEIAEWKFMSLQELNRQLMAHPEHFTPWFKLEWARMEKDFLPTLKAL